MEQAQVSPLGRHGRRSCRFVLAGFKVFHCEPFKETKQQGPVCFVFSDVWVVFFQVCVPGDFVEFRDDEGNVAGVDSVEMLDRCDLVNRCFR